jgi:hypothetical protein
MWSDNLDNTAPNPWIGALTVKNVNISRDYYYREKGRLEGTLAANEMGIGNLNVINYFFLECQNCNRLSCRRRESVIQLIDKKEERTLLKVRV